MDSFKLQCANFERCVNGMFRVVCKYNVHFMPFFVTGGGIQLVAHWPLELLKDCHLAMIGNRGQFVELYDILKDVV